MPPARVKYSRRVRMYKEGFLSVCVYMNVMDNGDKHYDTVIYRKIGRGSSSKFKRGTSLKPTDLLPLISLAKAAHEFITAAKADAQSEQNSA